MRKTNAQLDEVVAELVANLHQIGAHEQMVDEVQEFLMDVQCIQVKQVYGMVEGHLQEGRTVVFVNSICKRIPFSPASHHIRIPLGVNANHNPRGPLLFIIAELFVEDAELLDVPDHVNLTATRQ